MDPYKLNYLLRDIDPLVWERAQARAADEGRTLRGVLLLALGRYAAARARFCMPCDEWVGTTAYECPKCGADTEKAP